MYSGVLIGDIVERNTDQVKPPPAFDEHEVSATGFPAHRRRPRVSAFEQQRQVTPGTNASATGGAAARPNSELRSDENAANQDFEAEERRRIDRENRAKLENMTPEEIEKERAELMNGLSPALLERLLRRANIDEKEGHDPFSIPESPAESSQAPISHPPEIKVEAEADLTPPGEREASCTSASEPSPSPAQPTPTSPKPTAETAVQVEDRPPAQPPADLFPISEQPPTGSTHFPAPPALPDLNPSDPDFLDTLHKKFFPTLPADPSKLAWMAPIPTADSPADRDSPYYPGQESLPISALRFDFRGALLPPRLSRTIPVSKGLHHHGKAPEAAGYTIEELAILARSAVPAQRCIAFQTLGRILYRLGKGEWGTGEEDTMARGIWDNIMEGRVLDSLAEAATNERGHRGSQAYAMEALWLLERGGWKTKWSGR
ncbi:hypothetical protein SODALDRAFT_326910 [Sodiomyces alkalinus F11]|uniref:RNA polymerase II-associated protein RBA50 n=1 Tax=Sodiomyces alkalinus (strain CBS 110278 / VKM F-3762 / F11) TaxID=1314773 RepID=A0A3N2Q7J9_SODAK|nr:hypothetical protein SODALDRAFT_326910 [Sodiomyces alkalinus F11]ROT42751.1 hypothetical protein SODALDRAFT_326910 [Sodiomyces alkalinus F11]